MQWSASSAKASRDAAKGELMAAYELSAKDSNRRPRSAPPYQLTGLERGKIGSFEWASKSLKIAHYRAIPKRSLSARHHQR